MFDNLRDEVTPQSEDNQASQEDIQAPQNEANDVDLFPDEGEMGDFAENYASPASIESQVSDGKILGLTGMQRFILACMLLAAIFTLGTMCLLITGKIGLI